VTGPLLIAACAAGLGSLTACLPGLHVLNVLGIAAAWLHHAGADRIRPDAETLAAVAIGFTVAYSVLHAVPAVFFSAPDDSAALSAPPSAAFLRSGRAREAVLLSGFGSAAGLAAILTLWLVLGPHLYAPHAVLRPHLHWVIWCVIAFMLLSEWPRPGVARPAGWPAFLSAWSSLFAGLLTFALSGWLGLILFHSSPLRPASAFQGLLPAFVGLFTVPSLLIGFTCPQRQPAAVSAPSEPFAGHVLARGSLAGILGGVFAAYVPAVTPGVGGLVAGHATSTRDTRAFLISQGAARSAYYAGALLLFFLPGLRLQRGGTAALLAGFVRPTQAWDPRFAPAAVAIASAVALLLLPLLSGAVERLAGRWTHRRVCAGTLFMVTVLVAALTGLAGLLVAATAAGIGLLPLLFGARRMNTLGVILLPVACNLSGFGPAVTRWMGLG
jgi:putative membrane protein